MGPLANRMLVALVAIVNAFVAAYLHLWKYGLVGANICSPGGDCYTVQYSPWGLFLGVDVALIGTWGYSAILVTALVGLAPAYADDRRNTALLAILAAGAVLFTWRLKYYEWIVLERFCPWCFISTVSIHVIAFLVWRDWKRLARRGPATA